MRTLPFLLATLALAGVAFYGCDENPVEPAEAASPSAGTAALESVAIGTGNSVEVLWAEFDYGNFGGAAYPRVARGVENVTWNSQGYVIKFRRRVTECAVVLNPSYTAYHLPKEAHEHNTNVYLEWDKTFGGDVGPDELFVSALKTWRIPDGSIQRDMIPHTLVLFCPPSDKQ